MKLRIVMLAIVLPLLGLAAFYAETVYEADLEARDVASLINSKASEQAIVNELIHELQRERGFSAGYIGSSGANFISEIREQRSATDDRIPAVMTDTKDILIYAQETFELAKSELQSLPDIRAQVTALEMTVSEMASFYSGLINHLLTIAYPLNSATEDNLVAQLQTTVAMLAASRENAGLERAMGAAGLGGTFTQPIQDRLARLQGAQKALLLEAAKRRGEPQWVADLEAADVYQAVAAARETMVAGYDTGEFDGMTAGQWFTISSAWIEYLHEQEVLAITELVALSADITAQSDYALQRTILVGLISIILVGICAIAMFEWIIWRIKKLTDVVDGFAEGDFTRYVPTIDRKDEISRMARAIYHFKQETLAMRREAENLKAADEEVLNAKHGAVVALVTKGLDALAKSDLTCRFDDPLDAEYDSIRDNFNTSTSQLREVLRSIAQTVATLDQSTDTMTQSAEDLSTRSQEQMDTISGTATQAEALSAEVDAFGGDVGAAAALAQGARGKVAHSEAQMQEAIAAMARIKRSSGEISKTIEIIEDISFQTNLLSLNAGVEAARAGVAGAGFAVVASEVGQLAQRASDASSEIKALIQDSGAHVQSGVALVERTGESLKEITHEIAQVDDVLARVSEGAQSQVDQLKELSGAMNQISALASQNATMAAQTRTSSGEISTQSRQLADAICDFKLEESAQQTTHPANYAA